MTDNLLAEGNVKYITESDKISSFEFGGEKILFSEPHAWCVKKDLVPKTQFQEWVQINMREEYLLYGLKVDGYKDANSKLPSQHLTKSIKMSYSLDASRWATYEGGRVCLS